MIRILDGESLELLKSIIVLVAIIICFSAQGMIIMGRIKTNIIPMRLSLNLICLGGQLGCH